MLNDNQLFAIKHNKGVMLVIAGPGSGKTTVITKRIEYLNKELKVPEENILVITFTALAAMNMKKRYEEIISKNNSMVSFGTFHRIFFNIIREEYSLKIDNIIDSNFKYNILLELINKHIGDVTSEDEMVSTLSNEIARVKEEVHFTKEFSSSIMSIDKFKLIYKEYHKIIRKQRLIDFEDMEILAFQLMKKSSVRKKWQNKFSYILIDEFQDINRIQFEVIKCLIGKDENLFLVGDDDQSIYEFRGASPEIMLNLDKEFSKVKKAYLNENYRCKKLIVDYSQKLIKNNLKRFDKKLLSMNDDNGIVNIRKFEDEWHEAKFIADEISNKILMGVNPSYIAILFRSEYVSKIIAYYLFIRGIPIEMKYDLPNITKHWAVQDIITYFKLSRKMNISDLCRIINRPARYITRLSIEEANGDLEVLRNKYRGDYKKYGKITMLKDDLKMLSKLDVEMGIKYIIDVVGYRDYINEYCKNNNLEEDSVYEMIEIITNLSKESKNYDDWIDKIHNNEGFKKNKREEAVKLLSMHSSKGLEFSVVYLIGINEGVIPHKKDNDVNIEEERRLMYVAMTRAKDELNISYCELKRLKEIKRSCFINEITEI